MPCRGSSRRRSSLNWGTALRVFVESVFECPATDVWNEVQKPSLLLEIVRPLARIRPVEPPSFPERWEPGTTFHCSCWFLGFIPLGRRSLCFERIDQDQREIQTHESDALIRRWDHLIRVEPTSDGRTLYSDRIDIGAGVLTPLVWLSAIVFYRHRQRRWRNAVIPRLSKTH